MNTNKPTIRNNNPCRRIGCGCTGYYKDFDVNGTPTWICVACDDLTKRQTRTSKKAVARKVAVAANPILAKLSAELAKI